ncbi:Flp family type IVb pilin [Caldinitratiruptor microaerophilus]|uniref:Pilus assembly protein Flp/PilA n=1 Tax=Caldinitratiruptor microaerophilus TaxID=671077 RepID=A0AA35CMT9_9FIRM|nr:Flp family type IVb pilin [Caldinitratiruptor microaerophilus]BDG60251.1 hypothetical protein caldi_13410 [Caldinitratiruptor microaerophilus]
MLALYVRARNLWARLREEHGQGMVEYGLILALVAVVLIGVLGTMTGSLDKIFKKIAETLNGVANPPPSSS